MDSDLEEVDIPYRDVAFPLKNAIMSKNNRYIVGLCANMTLWALDAFDFASSANSHKFEKGVSTISVGSSFVVLTSPKWIYEVEIPTFKVTEHLLTRPRSQTFISPQDKFLYWLPGDSCSIVQLNDQDMEQRKHAVIANASKVFFSPSEEFIICCIGVAALSVFSINDTLNVTLLSSTTHCDADDIVFSGCEKFFAASKGLSTSIFKTDTLEKLSTWRYPDALGCLYFTPDSQSVIYCTIRSVVRERSLTNDEECKEIKIEARGHMMSCLGMIVSCRGRIGCFGDGSTVFVCSLDATEQKIYQLKGHRDIVTSAAFVTEDILLTMSQYEQALRLWDLSSLDFVSITKPARDCNVSVV